MQISKTEFKAKALEFFRQIETSGVSVVVTDHGRPTLEVRPYREVTHNPLVTLKGSVASYRDPTKPIATSEWDALK